MIDRSMYLLCYELVCCRLMISVTASTVTPSLDLWSLGISLLKHVNPIYVEKKALSIHHLMPYSSAFGLIRGVPPAGFTEVKELVSSLSNIYAPICYGRTYKKMDTTSAHGDDSSLVYGKVLEKLLVAPSSRSESHIQFLRYVV